MNATYIGIERQSPAQGPVCLLLRSKSAHKILVIERRDHERVMCKPGFVDYRIDCGLAGKVGNVELAAADRFYIRQRRPDNVLDTGILRSVYRRRCLLALVGTFVPEIGDQKDAMCALKCSSECVQLV